MEDTTELLAKEVLPDVPIRQWVLSPPFELRTLLAYDPDRLGLLARMFVGEVFRSTNAAVARQHRGRELAVPTVGGGIEDIGAC